MFVIRKSSYFDGGEKYSRDSGYNLFIQLVYYIRQKKYVMSRQCRHKEKLEIRMSFQKL